MHIIIWNLTPTVMAWLLILRIFFCTVSTTCWPNHFFVYYVFFDFVLIKRSQFSIEKKERNAQNNRDGNREWLSLIKWNIFNLKNVSLDVLLAVFPWNLTSTLNEDLLYCFVKLATFGLNVNIFREFVCESNRNHFAPWTIQSVLNG